MKLPIDQGVFSDVAQILRTLGTDALHTSEVGLARAQDFEIIDWAAKNGRVIVTQDADFHTLLAGARAASPSAIRIRGDLKADALAALVFEIIQEHESVLNDGAAISATSNRVRIHRLPLR